MHFSLIDGRIHPALFLPSPNHNARPEGVTISLLVVHNISLPPGEFGGGHIQALFHNRLDAQAHPYFTTIADLRVSAHCLISRTGELTQFVNLEQRAWHAGVSCFDGVENCNDYSIGVELEGTDDTPYTEPQYRTLAALSQTLLSSYPELIASRIVGHSTIAPGRKTDPGQAFDWPYFFSCLADCGHQ